MSKGSSALTGLSLMMRAGSVNMSVLTEVVFAPVFSAGGGVAFCKNKNKTPHKKFTSHKRLPALLLIQQLHLSAFILIID